MTTITDEDFWKPFGESTWRDFAQTVGASELQLKFACARFNGASASAAAKIAGYAGDSDSLRRAGYAVVRSAAVVALIELAETNAPEAAGLTDAEVAAKVAKLVRSPDPQISLKATELFDKRQQRKREAAENAREESAEEVMCSVIASVPESAVGAFLAMSSFRSSAGSLVNFPFLRECAAAVAKNFPVEWQQWKQKEPPHWSTFLDQMASRPILEGDELTAAVKSRLATRGVAKPAETTDAA